MTLGYHKSDTIVVDKVNFALNLVVLDSTLV